MLDATISARLLELRSFPGQLIDFSALENFALDNGSGLDRDFQPLLEGTPFVLTQTQVAFLDPSIGGIRFTGTGFGPLAGTGSIANDYAALRANIEASTASGTISGVELLGTAGEVLAQFSLSASGIVMTSGDQTITLSGVLPTSLNGITTLVDTLEPLGQPSGTWNVPAIVAALGGQAINGLTLTDAGVQVLDLSVEGGAFSITIDGVTLTLLGTFPATLADWLELVDEINSAVGEITSLEQLNGLAVNGIQVSDSSGTILDIDVEITELPDDLTLPETVDFNSLLDLSLLDDLELDPDLTRDYGSLLDSPPAILSASFISWTAPGIGTLSLAGSGFGPISSFDQLEAAIDLGIATGGLDVITLSNPAGANVATILLTPEGIRLMSGVVTVTFAGVLPSGLNELGEIISNFEALAGPQSAWDISGLVASFGDQSLTGITIEANGTDLFDLQFTNNELSLSVGPLKLALGGTFPGTFADWVQLIDAAEALAAGPGFDNLDQLAGLSVNRLTLSDGDSPLLEVLGDITDEASAEVATVTLVGTEGVDRVVDVDVRDFVSADTKGLLDLAGGDDVYEGALFTQTDALPDRVTIDGGAGHDSVTFQIEPEFSGWLPAWDPGLRTNVVISDTNGNLVVEDQSGSGLRDVLKDVETVNVLGSAGSETFRLETILQNVVLDGGAGYGYDILVLDLGKTQSGIGTRLDLRTGVVNTFGSGPLTQVAQVSGFENYNVRGFGSVDGDAGANVFEVFSGPIPVLPTPNVFTVYGHEGNDTIYAYATDGVTDGFSLSGGADQDYIYGSINADRISGGSGNDFVYGENIFPGAPAGGGNDTIYGDAGDDWIFGGEGDDSLYGGANSDTIHGDDGQDLLVGGAGSDTLDGGLGNDRMFGGNDRDTMYGGFGDDLMVGGLDVDFLYGDGGEDQLFGGSGGDQLYGGDQDDRLYGGADNDYIRGGAHDDQLFGGTGGDSLFGDDGEDLLNGGAATDVLYGGNDNDRLFGGTGNDYLYGEAGNDLLHGGDDNDTLQGGAGRDVLIGGAGVDTFVFHDGDTGFGGPNRDVIRDFDFGIDRIDLTVMDANTNTFGINESFVFIGNSAFSGTAGELRYFVPAGASFTLLAADTNGNGQQDWQIELADFTSPLSPAFFYL